jgi:hypothetical protein
MIWKEHNLLECVVSGWLSKKSFLLESMRKDPLPTAKSFCLAATIWLLSKAITGTGSLQLVREKMRSPSPRWILLFMRYFFSALQNSS